VRRTYAFICQLVDLEEPSNDLTVYQIANCAVTDTDFPEKNDICFPI